MKDFGYFQAVLENLQKINETQGENITKAAELMCEAIANDRLIHVYGGGGHTTLPVGEMFFRAGGLSCINPLMETGLSVFNQALKYLELVHTDSRFLYVLAEKTMQVQLRWPEKLSCRNIFTGEIYENTDTVSLNLEAGTCAYFEYM